MAEKKGFKGADVGIFCYIIPFSYSPALVSSSIGYSNHMDPSSILKDLV